MQKPEIMVIVGPTASGKSAFAVRVAKKINGEIISADSRQIYRDLDVGTAKITKKGMMGIPHHLLNVASPQRAYTVTQFVSLAKKKIYEICARNHTPIIVGGTGFWIDALVYDFRIPIVPPNPALRRQLEKKSLPQLIALLKKYDPACLKHIDPKNPRRLIRAIEIARTIGKVPRLVKRSPYHTRWIGINPPKSILEKNIALRAERMIRDGLIQETRRLRTRHISKKRIHELGFEYRIALDYIEKKIDREQLRDQLIHATTQYARRQMTWWRKNKKITWISHTRSLHALAIPVIRHKK